MGRDDDLYRKAGYNHMNYEVLKKQRDRKEKDSREKAERKDADRRDLERWLNMSPAEREARDKKIEEDFKNDPIIKGITYVGKGIYKLGKEAKEASKIAGTTLINAYKITNGSIEVVNTDTDSKTQETIENSESNNSTASNSNSMVATTTKLAKGAIEVGKTTATTLLNAYKISTNSTEIVNTDANGKTQVVIKKPEPNTANSNNNSTPTTSTTTTANTTSTSHITSKTIELKDPIHGIVVKLQEKTIKTSLKLKLNKKDIMEIKEYRAITIPDTVKDIIELHLEFVFYRLDGSKVGDPRAALVLDYTDDGRIIKLSLPNSPVLSSKPLYPACIIYHGTLYTLPVNSGDYNHLTQEIYKNGGEVLIGKTDPAYHIEAI
ncbi:MAG: hypothetical protein RLZZ81_625 [Pseudomonadota bacterium]|jgi:hypothetical protein